MLALGRKFLGLGFNGRIQREESEEQEFSLIRGGEGS
jgi:hypothetical protein